MNERLRLRFSQLDGFELRCPHCAEWFPLDAEFWRMNRWDRCIACFREAARLAAARRREDPAFRSAEAERSRRNRAWMKANAPELVTALERERKARKRAWIANKRDDDRKAA